MKLRIAILGTRGIPNNYGGFEHISAHLAKGLVGKGHEVSVYNAHNHPYTENSWNGVQIIHCHDPEYLIGTAGQFIYDFNCLMHARKCKYDVILFMGYTSSSIWGCFYPKKSIVITNMDGLEWKRSKYSKPVQRFLKFAEQLAIKYSQFYIADSEVIQSYLEKKYGIKSRYIPYGADINLVHDQVKKDDYFLLMARMEPENNIEMILDGFSKSPSEKKFIVLGNTSNQYGRRLVNKFEQDHRIHFIGSNFDPLIVNSLQNNAFLYFHGHSVGGTNPSLLQAMANGALIAAHNNAFNKAVLGNDAFYFGNCEDVTWLVQTVERKEAEHQMIANNVDRIKSTFNWKKVTNGYEDFILECYQKINH
jgi:glycosyltransferase involved in cell wall biosynthesis